ncbi:hypothetical protein [Polynucleobacter sp. 80A-SIGWE]|uniref:hypothetical protein n=1 Tax=Polynucleobacter sp. 80A-SIGWE TaxID=2689100 RepID=UPI001C0C246A|nr:hypothetical protein [Polynucleobacter sp. 80A-SIGWE]MBU3589534.1 hypothetical protein [Polynucleobacter sp. 80A-SIGWE]
MNWLNHITSLSNPFELASFYLSHAFGEKFQLVLFDVIIILTIHGIYILVLTRLFKKFVIDSKLRNSWQASFFSYLLAIVLVVIAHFDDIFILTWVLDSLKIFPDPTTTLYYVSGMYTTIGSNNQPGEELQSLSIIIAFAGLFSFAISGAGLYTMLSFFLAAPKDQK